MLRAPLAGSCDDGSEQLAPCMVCEADLMESSDISVRDHWLSRTSRRAASFERMSDS